jgi:hypothetical protein
VESSLAKLGQQLPPNPNTNGRKLVESIFSHRAFTFDEDVVIAQDQERKDLSYMKKVMHRIGSKYGFIDTTSVFFIEWDATLAVDYNDVSVEAEKLRKGVTNADWIEIEFGCEGKNHVLRLLLNGQEAQKSHGLCLGDEPDVANLPAGEVYFVPEGAEGAFPHKYEDGTLGLMAVTGGRIVKAELIKGSQTTIDTHNAKLVSDPVTGELGELGLGTQLLPVSGRDIQDEKVRGTVHVATGRSDHLGGHLVPSMFAEKSHATHDDILFAPHKTPEILVKQVRMKRGDQQEVLIENYEPSAYLDSLVA